jgi:RNA polymerase sigma-70 factor (ECF subfamily)
VYSAALGRLCMAFTGSQAESEELVQETLLAAFDAFPTYRGEGSVRAWMFGIARRICGRHTEMRVRRETKLRLVHDTGRAVDAGELSLAKERAERARAALAKLKPSEREAVVLRFEADLSFKEVAEACGIDEAAARKRVSRALARLRAEIGEE